MRVRLPKAGPQYSQRDETENRRTIELAFDRIGEGLPTSVPPGPGPGTTAAAPGDVSLAIQAGPLMVPFTNQPSGAISPYPRSRPWFDAEAYRLIRLVADVDTIGYATSRLYVEYSLTPNDDSSWASPGRDGAPVTVDLHNAGPQKSSGWFPLADAARQDVAWRVKSIGGNGAITPVVGHCQIQFRPGTPTDSIAPTMEPMYWRVPAASVTPSNIPGDQGLLTSPCSRPLHQWVVPTPATVRDNPGSLLHATGFTAGSSIGTTIDEQADYSGPVKRFISPPLAAQAIPSFKSTSACVVRNQSALPFAGYVWIRLSLWRPSTDSFVAQSTFQIEGDPWFRYVEKGRILHVYFPQATALAGDRWVLDVSLNLVNGCGGSDRTQGAGTLVYYDGPYTSFVDGGDMSGVLPASYTTTPVLTYLSDTA